MRMTRLRVAGRRRGGGRRMLGCWRRGGGGLEASVGESMDDWKARIKAAQQRRGGGVTLYVARVGMAGQCSGWRDSGWLSRA